MRRLLKNFPAHSLSENVAESDKINKNLQNSQKNTEKILQNSIKEQIIAEIDDVKQDLANSSSNTFNNEIRILGELLAYLRQKKEMSLLMLCRSIGGIKLNGGIAEICSEQNMQEIITNEKYHAVIKEFFGGKGLGFKLEEKIHTQSAVDKLKELLGDKLIVK